MLNLLGPDHIIIEDLQNYWPPLLSYAKLHWYGKKSIKPRRKMGHVTAYTEDIQQADLIFHQLQAYEEQWKKSIKDFYE